jgi:hypothetical protein
MYCKTISNGGGDPKAKIGLINIKKDEKKHYLQPNILNVTRSSWLLCAPHLPLPSDAATARSCTFAHIHIFPPAAPDNEGDEQRACREQPQRGDDKGPHPGDDPLHGHHGRAPEEEGRQGRPL